jgi:hypothetical protein
VARAGQVLVLREARTLLDHRRVLPREPGRLAGSSSSNCYFPSCGTCLVHEIPNALAAWYSGRGLCRRCEIRHNEVSVAPGSLRARPARLAGSRRVYRALLPSTSLQLRPTSDPQHGGDRRRRPWPFARAARLCAALHITRAPATWRSSAGARRCWALRRRRDGPTMTTGLLDRTADGLRGIEPQLQLSLQLL